MKTGYRTLGHMFVLREILKGAGLERLQLSMDQHLSTIASFMYAFREHVAQGSAHGFLVHSPDLSGAEGNFLCQP